MVDFFLALLRFPLFFSLLVAFRRSHCKQTLLCGVLTRLFTQGKVKESRWLRNHDTHSHAFCLIHEQAQEPRDAHNFSAEGEKLYHGTQLTQKKRGDLSREQVPVVTRSFTLLHNIRRPISPKGYLRKHKTKHCVAMEGGHHLLQHRKH